MGLDERTLQILPPHEHEDYIRTFRKLVDIQCRLERHLHEFYLVYDQPLLDDILRIVRMILPNDLLSLTVAHLL